MARGRTKQKKIILTRCYTCRWGMLHDEGKAPDPLPPPEVGEGMCPACMTRCYAEGMADEASVPQPLCVNCHKRRAEHHQDGWCCWLSDTDHLPIQYSATERAVLQLVDEEGRPLVAPQELR